MDNNIPDSGHLRGTKIYSKGNRKDRALKADVDKEPISDQVSLSGAAKAKSVELKKVNEWVDILNNMPDDNERIENGKEALKKFKENPSDMIKQTADNIRDKLSFTD